MTSSGPLHRPRTELAPEERLRRLATTIIASRHSTVPDLAAALGLDAAEIQQSLPAIHDRLAAVGFAVNLQGDHVHLLSATSDATGAHQPNDRTSATSLRMSSPFLIGREAEVAVLLENAAARPSVMLVEGEAGIGKSRLALETISSLEPTIRILSGHCHPLRDPLPLGPVIESLHNLGNLPHPSALSPVIGALRPLLPELAHRLPAELPTLGDAHAERHRVYRAVVELLDRLGPALLVLEDLHWADAETDEFLRLLVGRPPANLAVLLTFRQDDLPRTSSLTDLVTRPVAGVSTAQITLAPLTVEEVRRMVGAMLSADEVSEDFARCLHERTEGLPFAVEEVVRSMHDQRELVRRGGSSARRALDALKVPASVRDSIVARCSRLLPTARRITQAASVLGIPATADVLAAAAGMPVTRAERALKAAVEAAIIDEVAGDRYVFRHALAAQAVYGELAQSDRRRLHQRTAEALEVVEPRPSAELARHFQAAGRQDKWIRWAEIAADEATSRQDDLTAARLLHDALLSPLRSTAVQARLGVKLGRAALRAHSHQHEAISLVRPMLDRTRTPGVRGHLRSLLGLLLIEVGDASSGHRELAASVSELRRRPDVASVVMLNLALPIVVEGRERDHREWLARATGGGRSGTPQNLTAASIGGLLAVYCGDPRAWRDLRDLPTDASVPAARRQLLWLSTHLAGACTYIGHYRRAREYLDDADHRSQDLGWGRLLPIRELAILVLDWNMGRWDGLESRSAAYAEAMGADYPRGALVSMLVAGWLRLLAGDLVQAERRLRTCGDAARAAGLIPAFAIAAAGLARVQLERGDPEAAYAEASPALGVIAGKEIWAWAAELAPPAVESLVAVGRLGEATDLANRFARGIQGRDAPLAFAASTLCRGMLGAATSHPADAARDYWMAWRGFMDLPRPYEAARACANLGLVLVDSDKPQGTGLLRDAVGRLDKLGASADADHLRRELRRRGIAAQVNRRGGRRPYGSQLSPREAEVAALVARGMGNGQIGAKLSLSSKTIESHVAAVMRKLAIHSRGELMHQWLVSHGDGGRR